VPIRRGGSRRVERPRNLSVPGTPNGKRCWGTFPNGSERAAPLGVASGRFAALDGWRGIRALLVALHHLRLDGHAYDVPAIRNAYLFVDFFFVLSGFVISHAYSRKVDSFRNILVFVVRRFGRLWPLRMVVLMGFLMVQIVIGSIVQLTPVD
jgi:peptidoglycan/LPS O-acetylase OafA/YrhL